MSNDENEKENIYRYAQTVRERMETGEREQQEIERKRREEEEVKQISQSRESDGESMVRLMPIRRQIVEIDKPRVSIFEILNGMLYGFIVGAVGVALVVFLVRWGQAGFPDIEVWLDGDGILVAAFVLIISGLVGGIIGAPIGGVIAYGLKN